MKVTNINEDNKNLYDNIIIHSFYNVYHKLKDGDIKKHLLMNIKNMIVNDLYKYKYIKVSLEKEDVPTMVYYFKDDMFDIDIIQNVYTMLQEILYDTEYKINIKYESK